MKLPKTPPHPEYWVLSLSGGKDSTALGLEWLGRHKTDPVTYPLDEVIYCDTGMESISTAWKPFSGMPGSNSPG